MTTLTLNCAACGDSAPIEIELKPKDLNPDAIKKVAKRHGWVVQFNGDNIDAYCSKKCAQ